MLNVALSEEKHWNYDFCQNKIVKLLDMFFKGTKNKKALIKKIAPNEWKWSLLLDSSALLHFGGAWEGEKVISQLHKWI